MIILSVNIKKIANAGWVPLLILGILVILAAIGIMTSPGTAIWLVNIFVALSAIMYGIYSIVYAVQVK